MYGFYLIITRKLSTSDNPLLTLLLTGVVGAIIISTVMPFVWVKPSFKSVVYDGCHRYICLFRAFIPNIVSQIR